MTAASATPTRTMEKKDDCGECHEKDARRRGGTHPPTLARTQAAVVGLPGGWWVCHERQRTPSAQRVCVDNARRAPRLLRPASPAPASADPTLVRAPDTMAEAAEVPPTTTAEPPYHHATTVAAAYRIICTRYRLRTVPSGELVLGARVTAAVRCDPAAYRVDLGASVPSMRSVSSPGPLGTFARVEERVSHQLRSCTAAQAPVGRGLGSSGVGSTTEMPAFLTLSQHGLSPDG